MTDKQYIIQLIETDYLNNQDISYVKDINICSISIIKCKSPWDAIKFSEPYTFHSEYKPKLDYLIDFVKKLAGKKVKVNLIKINLSYES